MTSFIKKDIMEILGLNRATVELYTEKELVIPEVENPTGRGTKRRYSARNLIEFAVIRELVAAGVPHKQIKRVFDEARRIGTITWFDHRAKWLKESRVLLVVYHGDEGLFEFHWRLGEITLEDVMKGHKSATIIDVSVVAEALKAIID